MAESGGRNDSQDLALLLVTGLAVAGGWRLWQTWIGPTVIAWLDQHDALGGIGTADTVDLTLVGAGLSALLVMVGLRQQRRRRNHRAISSGSSR